MRKISGLLAALGAVLVTGLALSACGDSVPGNAVAKVSDSPITKVQFDHWMSVAAASSAGSTTTPSSSPPVVPKPPDFAECVAYKQRTAPAPAKGQPTVSPAQYKLQCKLQYDTLSRSVEQFLISADWIQGEAADQAIKVTDPQIQTQFQTLRKQQWPTDAAFQKFLKSSGMTMADLLFRVKLDLLASKLRTKVTQGKGKVSDAEVQKYYEQNKSRFAQAENRDLRIVLTKTQAQAQAAKRAIQSGQSFSAVAKKASIDQSSKAQGGALLAVTRGQQEKAFDSAIFAAAKGTLLGPIKTQFGFYVFRVQKITPATQQSLAQAKASIVSLLTGQNQQAALTGFVKRFRAKWTSRTSCRKGFVVTDCKNAPKTSTTTGTSGQ